MSLLVRATALVGMPVVTVDEGDDVAEVKDVVYSPTNNDVVGFTLNKRGRLRGPLKRLLPWANVGAVGRDALMVASGDALVEPAGAPDELAKPPPGRNVIGNAVITDAGVQLAEVVDLVLEVGERGRVVGYELSGGKLLPIPEDLAVSGEAIVVPAAVEDFVADDLTGFGAAVDSFRAHLRPGAGPPA